MKTILVYSFSPDDWAGYQKTLDPLFAGTDIQIRNESLQNVGRMPENLIAILASSYETARFVEESLRPGVPVIWINHTLEKELVVRLQSISRESRISVASDTLFYSESRRRMLINLGISENRVEAWCEGMDENKLEPYVLKFENPTIKEKAGRVVIPMENRGLIGADTLMELLGLIGRLDLLKAASMREYFEKVCFSARRVGDILPISLPGLNERREDIPLLWNFLQREKGLEFSLSSDAMEQIRNHWYEGNVREIQNCLDYLGSLGKKNITREDLPPYMMDRTAADGRRKGEGEKKRTDGRAVRRRGLGERRTPAGAGGCQGACPRGKGNRAPVDCGISEKRGGVLLGDAGARDFKRIGGGGTDRNSSGERRSAPETLNGFMWIPITPILP